MQRVMQQPGGMEQLKGKQQREFNPRVLSLCAGASSQAIVNINGSVADINNLASPLPTLTLTIPTPGFSPAHEQDLRWNSSLPQTSAYLSPQDASPSHGQSPCCSPMSGYLTTGSTTSSSGLSGFFLNDSCPVLEGHDSRGRLRNRSSSVSISDQEPDCGRSHL